MLSMSITPPLRALDFLALVVEDDCQFRRSIEQALYRLDNPWQMLGVGTGQEALALIQGHEAPCVDLVLVDLGLPDRPGVEIIRQARQRWPEVPILVATVHRSASDVLSAIEAGACGYVDKSDTELTLSRAIESVLRGEYPISASLAQHLFHRLRGAASSGQPLADAGLLTRRELELLHHLSNGHTYLEASQRMGVSLNTVQTFSRRIFQKLEVRSKVQAINAAQSLGLL
jgi:two-component system, NarL family, nitrate/nitrite response regulator NarL